ncbi:MAG TPA: DUF4907 domain-containing protein [Bacteroidia bacterium]
MKKLFLILAASALIFSCNHAKDENKQDKNDQGAQPNSGQPAAMENREMKEMQEAQKNQKPKENPYKNAKIDIQVFNNDTIKQEPKLTGFGYNILIYDAVYNHQPHIPAINGMRGFHTKEQAHKAAELVVYKIRNNIMPPSLTPQELDSMGTLK